MRKLLDDQAGEVERVKAKMAAQPPPAETDPRIEALVQEIIGRVADKWTMLILEVLTEHGELRFTRMGELVGNISQKMLTKTVRQMEQDGLVTRTVHPVIPPRVEYKLTGLGRSLGAAFCGVWIWAEEHAEEIEGARQLFDRRSARVSELPDLAAPSQPNLPQSRLTDIGRGSQSHKKSPVKQVLHRS